KKIAFVIVIGLLIFSSVQEAKARQQDDFYKSATMQGPPPQLVSLQEYLLKNTQVNDVILSSNENSFAINALTGRKVVTSRRAHNDKFLDFDQEEIKAAIILYGNNTSEKLKILKESNIKYLYWDYYWVQTEYYFDQNGNIQGWFDPLIFRYPEKYGPILQNNGIAYFQQHTWLDPAAKYPEAVQYDLLFVSPKNYRSFDKPWKADLDPYLEEVWSYINNEQKIAVLYKINTS
ncbi:hypothetical protein HZC32_01145, partial [Candidatus Woesearchaeota archaeon]|nr:hypothetical protein [Candidatus Woesearchaeota archaeon]